MTTDLDERLQGAARALDHACNRYADNPYIAPDRERRHGRRLAAVALVAAAIAAVAVIAVARTPPTTPGTATAPTVEPIMGFGASPNCTVPTEDAKVFHQHVIEVLARLGWPVTGFYDDAAIEVEPPATAAPGAFRSFGEALVGDRPQARLFEAFVADGEARLLVAITSGLDIEEVRRIHDRSGALITEVGTSRIYLGTDGSMARAVEVVGAKTVIYVRSETADLETGAGVRPLAELVELAVELGRTEWVPTGLPLTRELAEATTTCTFPISTPGSVAQPSTP